MPFAGKPFWISTSKGDQFRPDVAYLKGTNRYLVVWRGPKPGSCGTFGALVEANAALVKSTIDISAGLCAPAGPNVNVVGHVACTATDGQAQALVVWSQGGGAPLTSDIFGRFVDAGGNCVGAPFLINTPADPVGYDTCVRAAWNAKTGRYLVVWHGPNDLGCYMPYGAVLDPSGNVEHAVMIGERTKQDSDRLYAVTAHPVTAQWLVAFGKFCRVVDFDGKLGASSSPPPINNTLAIYDAFATAAGYVVVGSAPYLTNLVQIWGATLTADGTVFGAPHVLQSAKVVYGARTASFSKSQDWLAFVSLHHNVSLPAELWCRRFSRQFADLDGKPFEVIAPGDYELANGDATRAVNTSNTETLVVWSRRGQRFGTITNNLKATLVEMQPGLIAVEDEDRKPVADAYIWVNDTFVGRTNASGWLKHPLRRDDKITAKILLHQHPSPKTGHDPWGGGGWAYHIWLTSVAIERDGTAVPWVVVDPVQDQILMVRKTNTLFGFNLVLAVQWNASQSQLDQIKTLMHDAGNRLYNATDGQLFVEHLTIREEDKAWSEADIRVHMGTGQAETLNQINMQNSYMRMYQFGQGSIDAGTYVHELLHYLCFLPDEYEEDGPKDVLCTTRWLTDGSGPYGPDGALSSCPMSGTHDHGPFKLCSSLPENPHNPHTKAGPEPCWDILYRIYTNFPAWVPTSNQWQLVRPTDRGRMLPGPASLPCPGWSTVDNPTSRRSQKEEGPSGRRPTIEPARFPSLAAGLQTRSESDPDEFTVSVADGHGRATLADVWLELDFGLRRLGRTDAGGLIRVSGASVGTTIRATSCVPGDHHVLAGTLAVTELGKRETITMEPQGAGLHVRVRPTPSPLMMEILVEAEHNRALPLTVTVTPHATRASVLVRMALDAQDSCYRGRFTSERPIDGGVICATVGRATSEESIALVEYQLIHLRPGATKHLLGADGYAVIALGRHTAGDGIAMLTRAALPRPLPSNVELVGGPYELAATTRFIDGVIRIFPIRPIDETGARRLQVLHAAGNGSEWHLLPTFWHPGERYVGGGIDIADGFDPRGTYVAVREA